LQKNWVDTLSQRFWLLVRLLQQLLAMPQKNYFKNLRNVGLKKKTL
jgi:hypothetical protein